MTHTPERPDLFGRGVVIGPDFRATRLQKQQESDARIAKHPRGFRRALSAEASAVTFAGVAVGDLPSPPLTGASTPRAGIAAIPSAPASPSAPPADGGGADA